MRTATVESKGTLGCRWFCPLLLVALLGTSCITTYLWGGSVGPDEDGDGAADINPGFEVTSWSDFLVKLALTPLTVVLDVCTFPIQAAVFGWEKVHEHDPSAPPPSVPDRQPAPGGS